MGNPCGELRFCNPTPYLVTIGEAAATPKIYTFLSVRSDQNRLSCKTREQNLSTFAPRKPNREQTALNDTASGLPSQGAERGLNAFSLAGTAPTQCKRTNLNQPIQPMKTFLSLLTAYVAAGAFGVAFVQTALTESLQQHSGTQSYVRVIR